MLLGKQLPTMPDVLKTPDALVPGCESKVWLYLEFDLQENCLVIIGDSDTRIVKGLLAIILSLYNGLTPSQVLAINAFEEFEKLFLTERLYHLQRLKLQLHWHHRSTFDWLKFLLSYLFQF